MLLLEDILNAQKLRRMAGQFPTGHYDHDARLAIGPCSLHADHLSDPAVEAEIPAARPTGMLQLSVTIDPHTGEPIFDIQD